MLWEGQSLPVIFFPTMHPEHHSLSCNGVERWVLSGSFPECIRVTIMNTTAT